MPNSERKVRSTSRRQFLKATGAGVSALAGVPGSAKGFDLEAYFQAHFLELSQEELQRVILRLERKYSQEFDKPVKVDAVGPNDGVLFGYGLDISRCIGCRRCVHACVEENNQSRDPQIHWIRVLEFERQDVIRRIDFEDGNPFYNHEEVPAEGKIYLPVHASSATTPVREGLPDYGNLDGAGRHRRRRLQLVHRLPLLHGGLPVRRAPLQLDRARDTGGRTQPEHALPGQSPRDHGVVEKCTFCLQRTRQGRYPACVEACPVGARKFGNLLDPDSEIRYLIEHKRTFVLKAELDAKPRFFYFYG